jgi:hypothetical protein
MNTQPIVVTHILPTGTSFGATMDTPSEAIFIPGHVSNPAGLEIGQEVDAVLVPNTREPDRTPWLAVRVVASSSVDTSLCDSVLDLLEGGGEWEAGQVTGHLGAPQEKVREALERLYKSGHCAKYQLWEKSGCDAPAGEWFTCFPGEVEFVTGGEDGA